MTAGSVEVIVVVPSSTSPMTDLDILVTCIDWVVATFVLIARVVRVEAVMVVVRAPEARMRVAG